MDNLPSRAEMRQMMRIRPALPKGRRRAMEEEDERYNPISPANGNTVMRGGAMAMSSRTPRLSMADKRALEIQQRHETPGTGGVPSSGVSQMRGGAMERMVGGSATPSMGLSEFRGGDLAALLDRTNVARSGRTEGQGHFREKSMPPLEMRGGKMRGGKHYRDGHALSEHLFSILGKAAHKKLLEGLVHHAIGLHGGAWYDFLDPNKNGFNASLANTKRQFEDFGRKVQNEFVNPQSILRQKVLNPVANEFTNKESVLRGKVLPIGQKVLKVAAPVLDVAGAFVGVPGAGQMISRGADVVQGINQEAKNLGYGRRCGGKKRRAPASAGDGRRKRADIVRKVMNERGISMIEASKVVKAEGLY